MRFVAPNTFDGLTALSVDININLSQLILSAISAIFFVPIILFLNQNSDSPKTLP